jgi:hypothetical protein
MVILRQADGLQWRMMTGARNGRAAAAHGQRKQPPDQGIARIRDEDGRAQSRQMCDSPRRSGPDLGACLPPRTKTRDRSPRGESDVGAQAGRALQDCVIHQPCSGPAY